MMTIMKKEENKPVLDTIQKLISQFLYHTNDPETRRAIEYTVSTYWDNNTPYEIQTMTEDTAEALLIASRAHLDIIKQNLIKMKFEEDEPE